MFSSNVAAQSSSSSPSSSSSGREDGGEGGSVGAVRIFLTHCMSMFLSVRSSLLTVNMAAFGTFKFLVMVILRQNWLEIEGIGRMEEQKF